MALILPSAITRNAILLPAYQRMFDDLKLKRDDGLVKSIVLTLGLLNPFASSSFMTGGLAPMTTSTLLGTYCHCRYFFIGGSSWNYEYQCTVRSSTERTAEIGLKKALGAREKDILNEFLTEAILMTVSGGIVGIGLGAFLGFAVSLIAQSAHMAWTFSVPIYAGLCLLSRRLRNLEISFGVFPARSARKGTRLKH